MLDTFVVLDKRYVKQLLQNGLGRPGSVTTSSCEDVTVQEVEALIEVAWRHAISDLGCF